MSEFVLCVVASVGLCLLVAAAVSIIGKLQFTQKRECILSDAVRAAEQIYGVGNGEAKRRYVREIVKQHGRDGIERYQLEAEVWRMKQERDATE